MDTPLLTWFQAVQLLALGPCLFMLFFLFLAGRHVSQVIVPVLYFLSLACSFLAPLLGTLMPGINTHGFLRLSESLAPAISFLLILQFIDNKMPAWPYWSILALPLLGGSSLLYATVITHGEEVCIREQLCALPVTFKLLYEIFSSALTFLLVIVIGARRFSTMEGTLYQRRHKYAVILALIILNLAVLGIDLGLVSGHVQPQRADIAITIMRIGFIYLVLTSVFRVFDHSLEIDYARVPHLKPQVASERDLQLAERVKGLLVQEKIYRQMELSREKLATSLAVTEHTLSRVINLCFAQSFSTLINQYRVQEAKERLANENTAVTVIAFEVGFRSIPSFNRVFREMADMSPTQYRTLNAGKTASRAPRPAVEKPAAGNA